MLLPFHINAVVPAKKLSSYLLDPDHPVGKEKARVFRAVGYTRLNANELSAELLRVGHTEDVASVKQTPLGVNYAVDGVIRTPRGGTLFVRTVWHIPDGETIPRLASAYPAPRHGEIP